jgi:hypothetical protein
MLRIVTPSVIIAEYRYTECLGAFSYIFFYFTLHEFHFGIKDVKAIFLAIVSYYWVSMKLTIKNCSILIYELQAKSIYRQMELQALKNVNSF